MSFHIKIHLAGRLPKKPLCYVAGELISGEVANRMKGYVVVSGKQLPIQISDVEMVDSRIRDTKKISLSIEDPECDLNQLIGQDFLSQE